MKNFKVIEKSRLNEFTMAKLIGGLVTSVIQIVEQQDTHVMRLLAFLIHVEIFEMVLIALETMELVLPT